MDWQCVVVRHSGRWDKSEYADGDEQLIFIPAENLSRDTLLGEIHDFMETSQMIVKYSLSYLTKAANARKIKVLLKSDIDFIRLVFEQEEPIVYVSEKVMQETPPSDSRHDLHEQPAEEIDQDDDDDENYSRELQRSLIAEFCGWIREPGRIDEFVKILEHGGYHNLSSTLVHGPADVEVENVDNLCLSNWSIPVAHSNDVDAVVCDDLFLSDSAALKVGSTFIKKDDLSIAVGKWHMQRKLEYCVGRSSKSRLEFLCKQKDRCPFKLRAVGNVGLWRIIKFKHTHTCQLDLSHGGPIHMPSKVIAAYFSKKLLHDGAILKPNEIITEVLREYSIELEYSVALRARNFAVEMVYGNYDVSYQQLTAYLHMLKQSNPETIYDLQTSHDHRFQYMFVALGVSISAFRVCMRPVIVVDGTHLKGNNKGILFVVVTKDGNEQCFPLADGVGPIENDEAWIWFMSRLKSTFGTPDGLLIVSDQHKSIKNAIEIMYPNAAHGLCYYHISKNLARHGRHIIAMFRLASYAYRHETFHKYWSMLASTNLDGAYKRLNSIGMERWARSQCPVRRYSFLTLNAAVCFNSRLLWARTLPICSLIEVVRNVIEKWFDERCALAMGRDNILTSEAASKLSKQIDKGRQLIARGTSAHLYKVQDDGMSFVVDLLQKNV